MEKKPIELIPHTVIIPLPTLHFAFNPWDSTTRCSHLRPCCTTFSFKTLYSHGASLPRSVNGFQQIWYPNCLGSKTKCLIPQVATISCSSVSHLTLSQARRAKRATASNPLSAASIPCPFCHCLLPAWIG